MFESWSSSETNTKKRRVFVVAHALNTFKTLQVDPSFLAEFADIKTCVVRNVFPRKLSEEETKCIQHVFNNRGFHVSLITDEIERGEYRTSLRLLSSSPVLTLSIDELAEDDILIQNAEIEILPMSTWLKNAEAYAIQEVFRLLRDYLASEERAIFEFSVVLPPNNDNANLEYRKEIFKRALRWVSTTTCYDATLIDHFDDFSMSGRNTIRFRYKTHRKELQCARLNARALLFLSLWSVKRRQSMATPNEPEERDGSSQDGSSLTIANHENYTNVDDWASMPVVLGKKIVQFLLGVDIGVMGEVRRL